MPAIIKFTRVAFAVHCLVYFATIFYAREFIFSMSQPLDPLLLETFLILGAIACVFVLFNQITKLALVVLWLCFIVALNKIFLLYELYYGYIGLLIALLILSPLSGNLQAEEELFFKKIQWVLLFVLSLTQTVSGFSKMLFPGWFDGEVFNMLMNTYVVRPQFKLFFGDLFAGFGWIFTLLVLFLETSLFFLFISPKLRKYSWLFGLILQFLILFSVQLSQISSFMIILYIFTWSGYSFKLFKQKVRLRQL